MKGLGKMMWAAAALALLVPGVAFAHGTPGHGAQGAAGGRVDKDSHGASGGDIATGMVYLDRNGNGVRDPGERGIGGVSVSNGLDVVQTDATGRYRISLPAESILFISKPAEFEVPVNGDNLPQFYYIHYPDGTPPVADFEFPVIDPTGPLPAAIDFALLPGRKNVKAFRVMGFADPQARTEEFQDQVREDIVNGLVDNPFGAVFGLVAGDVVDDNLDLYPRHIAMMGKIGIPLWNVPGNHDINFRAPDDRYSTQTYQRYFGPTDFSFNHGDVHFIGLDNVQYKGDGQGRYDNTIYRGYLSPQQLEWLRNDLKYVPRDKLIVIMTHISLITYALDGQGERFALGDNINTVNFAELLEVLAPFQRVYAIAGHDTSNSWKVKVDHTHNWHGDWFIAHTLAEVRGNGWSSGPRDERDVRWATMQDGNPNGYYVMTFRGTEVQPRFIPAAGDPYRTMRIVLDPLLDGTRDPDGAVTAINRGRLQAGTKVVVNLFDGGERDLVELSIDGGEYVAMANVLRNDPFMDRLRARFAGTPDGFSSPQPSSHIWEHPLPALEPGLHVLRVRALDEFGQASRDALTFELE
ncbi:MAG: calcineurin-like phosphoesterase family protein [Pseudomonadales bacterium]